MLMSLAAILLLLAALSYRYYAHLTLRWPRQMSFYSFRWRVRSILKRHGWTCDIPEVMFYPIMAKKGDVTVMVVCLHNAETITALKIGDLDGNRKVGGFKQIICVTPIHVTPEFREMALQKRIYIMHYSQLKSFAQLPSANRPLMTAFFEGASPAANPAAHN